MSILSKLEFALDFSPSEKEIAKYILQHNNDVLTMSIQKLSQMTYTSPATIVRLCRKIGLEGYSDFKIKYSAELQADSNINHRIDVNYPFLKKDNALQICQKLATLNQETILDTLNLIDPQKLNQLANILNQAKTIYLFGSGNSMLAALDFQHKMLRIGKRVELRQTTGEQIFLAYQCQADDLAILISYSGETSDTINYAKLCQKQKVPTLVITSLGENNLSKYGDYIINTGSREKIFNKIAPFASNISIRFILDILFSLVFIQNYDNYLEEKVNRDRKYDVRHPLNSPINENS